MRDRLNGKATRMIRLDRERFRDDFEEEETDIYRMNGLNLTSFPAAENVTSRDGESSIVLGRKSTL